MKQRLTDANELMKLIPSEEMVSKFAVANAPTVEAIPVKWIQGWNHFIKSPEIKRMLEGWEKEKWPQ